MLDPIRAYVTRIGRRRLRPGKNAAIKGGFYLGTVSGMYEELSPAWPLVQIGGIKHEKKGKPKEMAIAE